MASPRHQRIASDLNAIIWHLLDGAYCSCKVYQPIDVKIKEDTVVNPDLLIVYEGVEGHF